MLPFSPKSNAKPVVPEKLAGKPPLFFFSLWGRRGRPRRVLVPQQEVTLRPEELLPSKPLGSFHRSPCVRRAVLT